MSPKITVTTFMALYVGTVLIGCTESSDQPASIPASNIAFVTATPTPADTPTPTLTPTNTPIPTSTSTPTETNTPMPTETLTPTPTEIPTITPTPSATATPTNTPDRVAPPLPQLLNPSTNATIECERGQEEILVIFEWTEVSDPSGVARYEIIISNKTFQSKTNNIRLNMPCGDSVRRWRNDYIWRVRAVDNFENPSASSAGQTFSIIAPDIMPPSVPQLLSPSSRVDYFCKNDPLETTFKWGGATDDRSGVDGYSITIQQRRNDTSWINFEETDFALRYEYRLELPCEYQYRWSVKAIDGVGNKSDWQDANSLSTVQDVTPPRIPKHKSPANTSKIVCPEGLERRAVDLEWNAVSDSSGVVSYQLVVKQRFGDKDWSTITRQDSIKETSYGLLDLSCEYTYTWQLRAIDKLGNTSNWSDWYTFGLIYDSQ